MMSAQVSERQELMTGPQVQRRYQKTYVTIWRWINDKKYAAMAFPKPIQMAGHNYWRISDLEAWEAAQAEKPYKPRACNPPKRKVATEISATA